MNRLDRIEKLYIIKEKMKILSIQIEELDLDDSPYQIEQAMIFTDNAIVNLRESIEELKKR